PRATRMFRFKSLLARIMFLHAVAVVVTAICMPVVLYWLFSSDVEAIQRRALQAQAEALADHLRVRPEGGLSLDLPTGVRHQYSEAYGRYAYTILDDTGRVLFASRKDAKPLYRFDASPAIV